VRPNWGRQQAGVFFEYDESILSDSVESYIEPEGDRALVVNVVHGFGRKLSGLDAIRSRIASSLIALVSSCAPHKLESLDTRLREELVDAGLYHSFSRVLRELTSSTPPVTQGDEPVVLEELQGTVDHIEGDTAYLILRTDEGEELLGECSVSWLADAAIREQQRFICRTVQSGGNVAVELVPVPLKTVTPKAIAEIEAEINQLICDSELDGDETE